MTGFVVLSTGFWKVGKTGAALTAQAFNHGLKGVLGGLIVALEPIFLLTQRFWDGFTMKKSHSIIF